MEKYKNMKGVERQYFQEQPTEWLNAQAKNITELIHLPSANDWAVSPMTHKMEYASSAYSEVCRDILKNFRNYMNMKRRAILRAAKVKSRKLYEVTKTEKGNAMTAFRGNVMNHQTSDYTAGVKKYAEI